MWEGFSCKEEVLPQGLGQGLGHGRRPSILLSPGIILHGKKSLSSCWEGSSLEVRGPRPWWLGCRKGRLCVAVVTFPSSHPFSDIIMMEDVPGLAPGPAPSPAPSPTVAPDPAPAPDAYRPVGLTKAVLSLHTQKEEQAFLSRFRDLGRLRGLDTSSVAPSAPGERGSHLGLP